jgi:hypothetical protein
MMSSSATSHKALASALWVNAGLLAVILIVLLTRSGVPSILPAAYGQVPQQQPIAGGGGVFVMPAQMSSNVWGAYLLDVDSQTLAAYQYFPGEKKLRLAASRSYKWDRRLENFNTDNPTPGEVEALVAKQQAGQGGQGGDKAAPAPDARDK